MNRMTSIRRLALAALASALVAVSLPASAQDVTPEQLNAARAAVAAIKATDPFDAILPEGAEALKQQLINKNPDMQEIISTTVDEKALALAPRRADLEKEAATAYARNFTVEQLDAIAAFYNSDAGKALLEKGPLVLREVGKAAQIWQNGIGRDLQVEVGKSLDAVMAAQPKPAAPATAGEQPAAGEAPAN
jgi:uncharacterized protein